MLKLVLFRKVPSFLRFEVFVLQVYFLSFSKTGGEFHHHFMSIFCAKFGVQFGIQVSLAIRGGYVPGKLSTANTKTPVLSLK